MKKYSLKYRLINFLAKRNLLKSINFIVSNSSNKNVRKIPIIGGIGKDLLVESEPWMLVLITCMQEEILNKVFLDIGVNIGQTLIKVKELLPLIDYVGFEPNPYCVNYLLTLIKINNIKNVSILPVAISNSRDHLKLNLNNESEIDSTATILNSYSKEISRKLDIISILPNDISKLTKGNIGLIKIDVEGAELEVLSGLMDIISKNRPYILIEILPVYNKKNKIRMDRQISIESLLRELRYSIFRINESNGCLLEIDSIGVHSDLNKCNYLLKPNYYEV